MIGNLIGMEKFENVPHLVFGCIAALDQHIQQKHEVISTKQS
jgi:hypothetical protein